MLAKNKQPPVVREVKAVMPTMEERLICGLLTPIEDIKSNFSIRKGGKGRGVYLKIPCLPKGSFVMEYEGDIISHDEVKKRQKMYEYNNEGCFIMDFYFRGKKMFIDATRCFSSYARLMNHSKNANIKFHPPILVDPGSDVPRIAAYACRDIKRGEEIVFDYGIRDSGIDWLKTSEVGHADVSGDERDEGEHVHINDGGEVEVNPNFPANSFPRLRPIYGKKKRVNYCDGGASSSSSSISTKSSQTKKRKRKEALLCKSMSVSLEPVDNRNKFTMLKTECRLLLHKSNYKEYYAECCDLPKPQKIFKCLEEKKFKRLMDKDSVISLSDESLPAHSSSQVLPDVPELTCNDKVIDWQIKIVGVQSLRDSPESMQLVENSANHNSTTAQNPSLFPPVSISPLGFQNVPNTEVCTSSSAQVQLVSFSQNPPESVQLVENSGNRNSTTAQNPSPFPPVSISSLGFQNVPNTKVCATSSAQVPLMSYSHNPPKSVQLVEISGNRNSTTAQNPPSFPPVSISSPGFQNVPNTKVCATSSDKVQLMSYSQNSNLPLPSTSVVCHSQSSSCTKFNQTCSPSKSRMTSQTQKSFQISSTQPIPHLGHREHQTLTIIDLVEDDSEGSGTEFTSVIPCSKDHRALAKGTLKDRKQSNQTHNALPLKDEKPHELIAKMRKRDSSHESAQGFKHQQPLPKCISSSRSRIDRRLQSSSQIPQTIQSCASRQKQNQVAPNKQDNTNTADVICISEDEDDVQEISSNPKVAIISPFSHETTCTKNQSSTITAEDKRVLRKLFENHIRVSRVTQDEIQHIIYKNWPFFKSITRRGISVDEIRSTVKSLFG